MAQRLLRTLTTPITRMTRLGVCNGSVVAFYFDFVRFDVLKLDFTVIVVQLTHSPSPT